MVGVARIELATPAMSMRWLLAILSFKINMIDEFTGALTRNLPNSLIVSVAFRLHSIS